MSQLVTWEQTWDTTGLFLKRNPYLNQSGTMTDHGPLVLRGHIAAGLVCVLDRTKHANTAGHKSPSKGL